MSEHEPLGKTGWDAHQPDALARFLAALPAKPQLLGLGEPTHGVQDFPRWRNRIFKALVQEHGFRSMAIESDIVAGLQVGDYVLGGAGTLDEVMGKGFSHGFGAYAANRELVEWLRKYSLGRDEAGVNSIADALNTTQLISACCRRMSLRNCDSTAENRKPVLGLG